MKILFIATFCFVFCINYGCTQTKNISLEKKLTISYLSIKEVPDTLPLHIGTMKMIQFLVKNNLDKNVEINSRYKSNIDAHYSKLSDTGYIIKDTLCDAFLPEPRPEEMWESKKVSLKRGDSVIVTIYTYPPICLLGSGGMYELNFLFRYTIGGKLYKSETGWRKLYLKE